MIQGSTPHFSATGRSSAVSVDAQEAFDHGARLEARDELLAAEEAFRAADDLGHPTAAVRLGVLLEERDDFHGAEQAFRRADARGDAVGAFHLAWMLQENGEIAEAERAYRRAETRGHPAAHSNLRMMAAVHGVRIAEPDVVPAADVAGEVVGEVVGDAEAVPDPGVDHGVDQDRDVIQGSAVVDEATPRRPAFATDEIDSDAADQLAIALAAMSAGAEAVAAEPEDFIEQPTVELGRPLRPVAWGEATRGRGRTAPRAPEPPPSAGTGRRSRRGRSVPTAAPPQGLARRALGVMLPVIAFGVAFSAGASTRTQAPLPAGLAPAAKMSSQSVRLAPATPVPAPAPLPKPRPAKPKTGAVSTHTGPSDQAVVVPLPPVTGTRIRVRASTSSRAGG